MTVLLLLASLLADEGMWPYNQFPRDAVNQKYKFDASQKFLDRLRLASVRIGGGSGAFVSANGLLLTNQHLISNCRAQEDLFYETTERKCPAYRRKC